MKYKDFEQSVLYLAYNTDLYLTEPCIANKLKITIEETKEHLKTMVINNNISYYFLDDTNQIIFYIPDAEYINRGNANIFPPSQKNRSTIKDILPRKRITTYTIAVATTLFCSAVYYYIIAII